jgi:low temperature requirement protein LtrA
MAHNVGGNDFADARAARSLVSPDDQKVTFVELFFDLVFVFGVTQIVKLFHDGITVGHTAQAVLIFWLVWWGWTQFTWALNAADTTHPLVELATLAATAIAFFMAIAIPSVFRGGALWFALPYVLGRVVGLMLYGEVAHLNNPSQHAAVKRFSLISMSGLLAVLIGGFLGGFLLYVFWGIAILLDIVAATIGARSEHWQIHPEHFTERHGLFVIIALGESLIVAAAGVATARWTGLLLTTGVLAVAVTCALWWSYFVLAKDRLEHALASCGGAQQSEMARDAFSLIHFPLLFGIILYAAVIEEAVLHPDHHLGVASRLALGSGIALFAGGIGLALWRAGQRFSWQRVIWPVGLLVVLVPPLADIPAVAFGVALTAIAALSLLEQRPWRSDELSFDAVRRASR